MTCDRKIGPFSCCSVVQGDCLELMKQLPDGCVDYVLADPPYNVGLNYDSISDNRSDYKEWCRGWFLDSKRISRTCVMLTPGMVSVPMWLADIERTHYLIAWTKQNNCSRNYIGKTSGFQTWEPVLVFGKAKKCILRDSYDCPISIQPEAEGHPCPKPLNLWAEFVSDFTLEGDTVFDPFMGSGTTAVAAKKLGRHFLGFEISAEYCQIARERLAIIEAQPTLFEQKPEQKVLDL
jgi:site-specific DNA-methyltransferase (adenine-specific)